MFNLLNSDQQKVYEDAIKWYNSDTSQIFEIAGAAGTGKSFLMHAILEGLGLNAFEVLPMAYTGAASLVMRKNGFINASSIHSALYELVEYETNEIDTRYNIAKKKKDFRKRISIDPNIKLFFIDEAYMVPRYMYNDIISFGIKIIAAGDPYQLPPVGDDPCFLINEGVHYLNKLMRQAEQDPIVYLAMRAKYGEPIHNGMYGNSALVINEDEFNTQMIGYADVIACGTNRTRDYMNSYIRQLAGFTSKLPRLTERLICRQNNWSNVSGDIPLVNGLTGTVVSQPDCINEDNHTFNINFRVDNSYALFQNLKINLDYFLGDINTKKELKELSKNVPYIKGEFFEYAYCLTTHLLQGSEYDNGVYKQEYMHKQMQQALDYTAITRFKKSIIIIRPKIKPQIYINSQDVLNQLN